ncbi:restriction endonuclease subunit S [Thermomonas brevis]|uniref:Restriction endonuclease subunit S n=1 Tax=Thermomonas brevis TaxID=215691 RepID=A0A7G9QQL7_9GAMM|nr:restriction endonuclease subunit S [Thermomonas brevis]QNN45642.1 restriction endonuclease subunit S [Thermomonas brevis]
MTLPRYPDYKDSGVPWLGEVPGHWESVPARRLFGEKREPALDDDEQLSATQRYGVIPQRMFMETADQKVVLALAGTGNFKHVEVDDFVISLRSFQGGIEWSAHAGCVSPAYTVLRAVRPIHSRYWAYLLKSSAYIDALQTVIVGIREGKNITYSQFGGLPVPVPSPEEQTTIACFLDHETAKIDALIAEQETLLALLAEKRQATISHAVTRGLNPNVAMKDSGIAWLGEVPGHWEVLQLRRVVPQFEQGWSPECEARPVEDGEWGVLKAGCLNGGVFNAGENKALPSTLEPREQLEVRHGDVLMSRASGSPKLIGSVACVENPQPRLMLSDKIFRLVLDDDISGKFFGLAMSSISLRAQIEQAIGGAEGLANNLPQASIKEFWLALPLIDEQQQIVEFLDAETAKLDALKAEAQRGIELLKERRNALIAAAVTGKIDVRNAA